MKKILIILAVILLANITEAKDLSGVKIYINPGHGGYHAGGHDTVFNTDRTIKEIRSNDRNVPTINYEPLDTNGFWESKCNLIKGLELKRLLESAGAEVKISRTLNREIDDRPLREIGEEANDFKADAFISIHTNAAGMRARVNYFLNLFNRDANGLGKNPTNMALSQHQASMSISYLMDNDITVWSNKLFVSEDKPFLGYSLGVLRHLNVPGFLVEGTFHDYQPETHRLLNKDYAKLHAWNIYRFYLDYFGADKPTTGVVAGAVKDSVRIMSHPRFQNWMQGSHDMYQPINGAKITLTDANGKITGTYTTDNNYNGVFVFRDVKPGTYTVKMEADGYETATKTIDVHAGELTDFVEKLYDSKYNEPKLIMGLFNKYAHNLTTKPLGNNRYLLEFELSKNIDGAVIVISEANTIIKDIPLGSMKKGHNSKEIDLSDLTENGLFWQVEVFI